jgi:hypothetical protein
LNCRRHRRFARFDTLQARRIIAQLNSREIFPYVAVNKNAFPNSASLWRRLHQIILPARTSTGFFA